MFFAINLRNDHHHSTRTAPPSNCKPTIGPPPSLPRISLLNARHQPSAPAHSVLPLIALYAIFIYFWSFLSL
ncbi:hypothetical protein BVRB_014660 [Beta vulgaris subsp. vulgaris]|uniref:Uncharacterized protein n=1 Tax=Beta vulgaris subsp. vulgaris TaxID=3555 RepID=A0A0J8B1I4_BETVV|nr:hypothetical protein BVRB_014660 [Beta vulgaris subsp. vulgaris]